MVGSAFQMGEDTCNPGKELEFHIGDKNRLGKSEKESSKCESSKVSKDGTLLTVLLYESINFCWAKMIIATSISNSNSIMFKSIMIYGASTSTLKQTGKLFV